MIAAIETTYKGLRFRSRLEARWAAFFDLLGWPWHYEPLDLNGYIPDFVLPLEGGNILAEVRPAFTIPELKPHRDKILRSGWKGEALLLGVGPGLLNETGEPGLGSLHEVNRPPWSGDGDGWEVATLSHSQTEEGLNHWGFYAPFGDYTCRVCNLGGKEGRHGQLDLDTKIEELWFMAQNQTQWRGRGA